MSVFPFLELFSRETLSGVFFVESGDYKLFKTKDLWEKCFFAILSLWHQRWQDHWAFFDGEIFLKFFDSLRHRRIFYNPRNRSQGH